VVLNTLGDGFIEAIDNTLIPIAQGQPAQSNGSRYTLCDDRGGIHAGDSER
jgi:hypothetical protein